MGFPRQEYWSGLPFPFPEDLLNPGVEPRSPVLAGGFFTTETPGKPIVPKIMAPGDTMGELGLASYPMCTSIFSSVKWE